MKITDKVIIGDKVMVKKTKDVYKVCGILGEDIMLDLKGGCVMYKKRKELELVKG